MTLKVGDTLRFHLFGTVAAGNDVQSLDIGKVVEIRDTEVTVFWLRPRSKSTTHILGESAARLYLTARKNIYEKLSGSNND
jgi:hypothetical protein